MVSFGSVRRKSEPWDTPPIASDPYDPMPAVLGRLPGGMFGAAMQSALGTGGPLTGANDAGVLSQALSAASVPPSNEAPQRPVPLGRGMFGAGTTIDQSPQAAAPASVLGDAEPHVNTDWASMTQPGFTGADIQVKRPGFFQQGGLGGKILHGLGEVALQYQASQGDQGALLTLRNRLEQQAAHRRAIEQVKQRQSERDEWLWRKNFDLEHPDDQFTRYMTRGGIDPQSDRGKELYRQRAENIAAPPMMAVDGFDASNNPTKTFIPRTALSSPKPQKSGPAPGTVRNGYRFKGGNPNDRTSWVPVGGASSNGDGPFPAVMDAVIGQESGGRAGVTGPQTRYGRAQGAAQLLPATAKSMAAKLGLPWRPELMTATHQAGAEYQRMLGEAYLREGIAATGNVRDGLRYYHGGPSRKQWGPITNAYADAVMARMGA